MGRKVRSHAGNGNMELRMEKAIAGESWLWTSKQVNGTQDSLTEPMF